MWTSTWGLTPRPHASTCVHLRLTPIPLRVDVLNGWPHTPNFLLLFRVPLFSSNLLYPSMGLLSFSLLVSSFLLSLPYYALIVGLCLYHFLSPTPTLTSSSIYPFSELLRLLCFLLTFNPRPTSSTSRPLRFRIV